MSTQDSARPLFSDAKVGRTPLYRLRYVDDLPVIETDRMILMIALSDHLPHIVRYLVRNRAHLKPWEPKRDAFYFTEGAWVGAPERDQEEARAKEAFRFRLLMKGGDGEFAGTVSLRDINFWPGFNATIGYSLDHSLVGGGLMTEAVEAIIRFGFEHLNLRRIEACYMPANDRSERLLTALGFQYEGLLRSSMEVDGSWEDHKICALINYQWRRV
jgi:ribosomal-protein-alanine N-acetyltransferase